MTGIDQLVARIARTPECAVHPAQPGFPPLASPDHVLPADLRRFFELCGGAELFVSQPFPFSVFGPDRFMASNPLLLGDYSRENRQELDTDRSAHWYLIAEWDLERIVIDLHPARAGRCYDGFWDVYATTDSATVARSFTELLESLIAAGGERQFWKLEGFKSLGNAYDDGHRK